MPMKPHKGESQSDFMSRCMTETFTGDRTQEQAVAICYQYWRAARGGKKPKKVYASQPEQGESHDAFLKRCVGELTDGDDGMDDDQATMACQLSWDENADNGGGYDRSGRMTVMHKEFADSGYQADGRKRYPLDAPDDVRLSWYLFNKNNDAYTEAQKSRIVIRITSAWKTQIDGEGPPMDATSLSILKKEVVARAAEDCPDPEDDESHDDYIERCVDEVSDDMSDDDARDACQMNWEDWQDEGGENSVGPVMHKTSATAEASGMEFVLSDATPDRFSDVIEVDGWEFDNFKNNPIALFNHDKSFPIGKWANISKTDGKALRGHLTLAPKGTSPRIDEIRRLIEADILRAVSVGFRPLEHEPINKKDPWGGTLYKKSELVECSLVAVPANPNALAVAKSLNISRDTVRMVFGEHADRDIRRREGPTGRSGPTCNPGPATPRGEHADIKRGKTEVVKTGEHAEIHERAKGKTMLLSQRITEAEKKLLSLQDNLDKHLEGMDDDNPSEEDMVITEDFTAKIETSKRHLKNLKAIEAKNGSGAADAGELTKRGGNVIRLPAGLTSKQKKVEDPFDYIVRAAVVRGLSKVMGQTIDDTRHKAYGDDEATRVICDMVLKAASAPAETTVPGWAQELVRTIWAAWMDVLLPMSVYPKLSAAGLALTFGANGKIIIPTRNLTPALSGSFVGEGQAIPVRQGAFSSQTLTPKKMAVITTWTREMDEHSIPAIEGLLRQAILEDTAIALDTVLLDNNPATAIRPPGLRSYQTGLTAAAVAGAFFANFVADYKSLYGQLLSLTAGNVRMPVLILNPTQVLNLSLIQPPAAAAPLFPFIAMVDGGRVLKAALIESATVPVGMAIMVDAADFTTAGAEGPRLEISDQATLHMEDTTPTDITGGTPSPAVPVKSMWQTDSLALRLIMMMNWTMRRPVSSWLTGTLWG